MNQAFFRESIDRICFLLIFILTIAIVFLIGGNKLCIDEKCLFDNHPQVKEFSWQDEKISASDRAFVLTFDRPMDRASVEKNLLIEPALPGRISWSGRRLVYTLDITIPYGTNYRLSLKDARERFRGNKQLGAALEPFVAEFQSRDRAFAYIGSEGEDAGRLILYNSTKQNQTILTPENLTVADFKFVPDGESIVFSASETEKGIEGLRELKLYQVTTGLSADGTTKIPGEVELILDDRDYQNNQFDLAGENGEKIVVQRINRNNPADFDLWLIEERKIPQPLNTKGGEFLVTPDRKAIAIAQGEGIAIVPIDKNLNLEAEKLDFLPKYGQVLTFSKDGSSAAMINFNKDDPKLRYSKTLVYVNNQGVEKDLINVQGSIVDCTFSSSGNQLYCLLTELVEKEEIYEEKPYFVLIDLKSNQVFPLVALPKYQDIKLSIAPDSFGILFDQLITSNNTDNLENQDNQEPPRKNSQEELITDSAEPILGSHLWLLTLPSIQSPTAQLEELPFAGFKPQWSP